ncbi:putative glutathione-specific gamma-glutamylcyclotransferase 2 isoform X3 [Varroa destructor]|uniref:glutathione-specific gamma-glutamylcyclotransferase n=1 Tax=Varroa destructor TaxID=109461 RepID=A0A7M7KY84_VARDE|nr:putative glutathione-specific gamma-glutamylcyclotransferase 2 isoform X3 [Varroa destructor]
MPNSADHYSIQPAYRHSDLENKSRVSGKKMKECSVWAFGYGSIIWKVDFPTTESCVGYVRGFVRRFYQGSTDHRGTPESPGRVVTLLPTGIEEDKVWGVAYRIPDEEVESVISHLDYREKGGFTRSKTLFFPKDSKVEPFEIIVYVAVEGNVNYLGPAPLDEIARTIAFSRGPSGTNVEYLFNLCKSMRELVPEVKDEHLFTLEAGVRKLLAREEEATQLKQENLKLQNPKA